MDRALRDRREAAMAFRMIQGNPLAMRVAAAHMAGLFEAPPAMLKAYMSWAIPLYAGHVLAYADDRRKTLQDRSQPIRDAMEATRKSSRSFEREMDALQPMEVAQWRIWGVDHNGVVYSQRVGAKASGTEDIKGTPMYFFDIADKRLTFRKYKWPRTGTSVKERISGIFTDTMSRLQGHLERLQKSSQDDGPNLVEMSMLVKEAKKYTSKAKSYKTSTKTTLPVDVSGWKYVGSSSPIIADANKAIKQQNKANQFAIEAGELELEGAQAYWKLEQAQQKDFQESMSAALLDAQRGLEGSGYQQGASHWPWYRVKDMSSMPKGAMAYVTTPDKPDPHWVPVNQVKIKPLLEPGDLTEALGEKGWTHVNVVLVFKGHKSRGGVWFGGEKRQLEVDVPFWGRPSTVAEFKWGLAEIARIARHEFQHVGQDLLRILTKGKEDRGLPSKSIRDPKRDPMGFPKTDTGRVVFNNRYREQHALQDVEFYTRLADEIGRFVAQARNIPLHARREAMQVWTGSTSKKKMEVKNGSRTLIVRRAPFFDALVTRQKGKWQKAVGEFVAGVEKAGVKIPRSSASRVADMYLEARSSNEWLQWMVQPFDVIKKHHKKFIDGPLDDATDAIIKDIAPDLVKAIVEQEVDEDVGEFLEGAQEGRFESLAGLLQDPESNTSEDYLAGYAWGYDNAKRWDGRDLPPNVKKKVVQEQLREFRGEITEQVVIAALEKAWATVNPREMFMTVMRAVKQHGWKIGLVYAVGEVIENLVIPAALTAITGVPVPPGSFAWLPLNDVVFAVIVKRLGGSSAVDDFEADGHLDWYEAKFGPVRIACLQDK